MVIYLKNKNKIKKGILGFSFTTFFFGGLVPLFRGDFKIFIPIFLVYISPWYFMPYTFTDIDGMINLQMNDDLGITNALHSGYYFVVNVLGGFFYNRLYTQALVKKGFMPVTDEGMMLLQSKGIKIPVNDIEVDDLDLEDEE